MFNYQKKTGAVSDTARSAHLHMSVTERCALPAQVVDYYRKKGAVSDIKADQDSERVTDDIRTVLKDTARS